MKHIAAMAALLLALPITLAPTDAYGCSSTIFGVRLVMTPSKIQVKPKNWCLYVADDSQPVNMTMEMKVKPKDGFTVAPNQIIVTTAQSNPSDEFPAKATDDPDLACDPGIQFNGTYVGGNEFEVAVTGQKTTTGIGCYDVEVKGLGTLDPRAKIVRRNRALNPAAEYAQVLDAIDVLKNTEYEVLFELKSVDEFFQTEYGVSEAEARRLANEYRDQQMDSSQ